jgi:hypothetical protein
LYILLSFSFPSFFALLILVSSFFNFLLHNLLSLFFFHCF